MDSGKLAAIFALFCATVAIGATFAIAQPPSPETSSCEIVDSDYGPEGTVPIQAKIWASGLETPWALAFLPGGEALVTERAGQVRLVERSENGETGSLVTEPVLTLDTGSLGEGGLLGLALHPRFSENRFFYLYFTSRSASGTVNRVDRYALSEDLKSARFDRTILGGIPAGVLHDGGRIRFGPDGMLYIGTGDGRQSARAQDPKSLAGKLLRVDPDGQVPSDNPFPGSAVFLSGIRNTQGFDWLTDGRVALSDHGPTGEMGLSGLDELSFARAGENLGWPRITGCETAEGLLTPNLVWRAALPPGGLVLYRGSAIPLWQGDLLIATLRSEHLHRVDLEDGRIRLHETYLNGPRPSGFGRLREVVEGPDGALYVTTSNCDGRGDCPADGDLILRIAQ